MSFDIDNFPISETGKRLLSYVTAGWYDKSYVGKWLYELLGQELDIADSYLEDFPNQLFPETATWGMKYHEQKFGLDVMEGMSIEERRMRVIEKRNTRAPATPWRMEFLLSDVLNCHVQVTDIMEGASVSHPNKFIVRLTDDVEVNLTDAARILNETKQSHTLYDLVCFLAVMLTVEEFSFEHVRYRLVFPWNDYVICLDGAYDLDGTLLLDNSEHPIFDVTKIRIPVKQGEDFRVAMYIPDHVICLDGDKYLDGTYYLNNGREEL